MTLLPALNLPCMRRGDPQNAHSWYHPRMLAHPHRLVSRLRVTTSGASLSQPRCSRVTPAAVDLPSLPDADRSGWGADVPINLEDEGVIGSVFEWIYALPGVSTPVAMSKRLGTSIAEDLKAGGVDGCLLVAT